MEEEEYQLEYGAEEAEVAGAMLVSHQALLEDDNDERIQELRSRPVVDEMQQLIDWQKAAELSMEDSNLYDASMDPMAMERAIERSKKEVDLLSMLDPARAQVAALQDVPEDMRRALALSQESWANEERRYLQEQEQGETGGGESSAPGPDSRTFSKT